MTEKEILPQITYDDDAEAGYIYLTSTLACSAELSNYTEELGGCSDILLDFNDQDKLIGIEFLPPTSHKLRPFNGKTAVFLHNKPNENNSYYSFYVESGDALTRVWLKEQPIAFLFKDESGTDFLGLEIHDNSFYSEAYLLGK